MRVQLLEREHPTAERHARAGNAGAGARNGNRYGAGGSLTQDRSYAGFIRGRENAIGVAAVAGGVFQIPLGDRLGPAGLRFSFAATPILQRAHRFVLGIGKHSPQQLFRGRLVIGAIRHKNNYG